MNSFVLPLLLGAPQGAESGGTGSMISTFIPFILIIGIFYFLIIRPQNKKQKETQKMLSAVKKGDKVVTIGGVHGVIQNVKETSVVIKVDENTKIEFSRSAIASVVDGGGKVEKVEDKSAQDDTEESKS
ncbi:preprotein translocase subunit YajC [Spirochaetia bacterium]|nr:preprotein translocase subunit YajC [Spirochaetia bacterium]